VTIAVDGVDALLACGRQPFDLVLMDCQMPEMDGLQATAELRARGHRMPIIALTAHALAGDRERCLQAGMDDYLTKPIEPRLLGEKLHKWLAPAGTPAATAPAGNPPPAAAPAYDAAALSERFLGDLALFGRAREIFLARSGPGLDEIVTAAQAGDDGAVRRLAHQLRGSALTIGAARLAHLCADVETAGVHALAEPQAWLRGARAALEGFVAESAVTV
jgi:CheY-like chemotaxis protein/HPt (histidine-containing phosphotransfer) domain-containing protein